HHDRDYRTIEEMAYETIVAAKERTHLGVERVVEIFTPANDVEHSFARAAHLRTVFNDAIPADIVEAAVSDAVKLKRDTMVLALQKARNAIETTLYA
ncbi:hypothetical protein AB0067_27490, partial [Klebsiella pneumoniae]